MSSVRTETLGAVLLITLCRPEARNSVDHELAMDLSRAARCLEENPRLAAAVLFGEGRGFSAGMDLKAFLRSEDMSPFVELLRDGFPKPTIAAVEGFALAGGLELALACDLIVAARGARLGIPEVTVGLFAAAGGLARLPMRVGYQAAMRMALTGQSITSEDGYRLGLVNELADVGRAVDVAMSLAEVISGNAPLAVDASRQLIREGVGRPEEAFWTLQQRVYQSVFSSKDAIEGPAAFAEKRAPVWSGE